MNYKLILPDNYVKVPLPGRDKWLAALRSGEYQQGQDCLRSGNRYCCIGVLCDVQQRLIYESEWNIWVESEGEEDSEVGLISTNPLYDILGSQGKFPEGVWVEVRSEICDCLVDCNDDAELDFKSIADIIESVWEA